MRLYLHLRVQLWYTINEVNVNYFKSGQMLTLSFIVGEYKALRKGCYMKRESVEHLISSVVEDIIAETDMELVDVEYVRERDWYLRVFLDKPDGIDLDDCQLVSEKLSAFLDEKDPIKENYLLEVSSPGIDRILKREKDYIRYNGRVVDIQLFKPINGQKSLVCVLQGFDDTCFTLLLDEAPLVLERSAVAQMRLHLEF